MPFSLITLVVKHVIHATHGIELREQKGGKIVVGNLRQQFFKPNAIRSLIRFNLSLGSLDKLISRLQALLIQAQILKHLEELGILFGQFEPVNALKEQPHNLRTSGNVFSIIFLVKEFLCLQVDFLRLRLILPV